MAERKTNLVISARVVRANIGKTKFSEDVKKRLSLHSESMPYDEITAYDKVGAKMTPSWYKDKEGYMNIASDFDIPVRMTSGKIVTFEEWIDAGIAIGADIKIKVSQKDGAVYPMAIVVEKDGEPFDPFEGM